jgi:hypothetical protein
MPPIVDAILDLIDEPGTSDEPVVFALGAESIIPSIFDRLFRTPGDPRPVLDEILAIVCALEVELRSPNAAAFLRTLMRADPRIVAVFEDEAWEGFGANPELADWSGAIEVKDAPMYDEDAPEGTTRLSALIDAHPLRRRMRV